MKYCPKCGKENQEDSTFCLSCGNQLTQNNNNVVNTNNNQVAKQSNVLAIIGFISALVGLFVAAVFFGTAGIVCSSIGLSKVKETNSGKGLAIAGLVIGIIDVIAWIFLIIVAAIGISLYY